MSDSAYPRVLLFVLAAGLCIVPANAVAQDSLAVRGVVQDSLTGLPIAAASIAVTSASLRVFTDAGGAFGMRLAPGDHALTIHAPGYDSLHVRLTVPTSRTIVFSLTPRPVSIESITVEAEAATAARRRSVPWSVGVVSPADMQRAGAVPVADVLQRHLVAFTPCPPRPHECVRIGGNLVRPLICIDERQALGSVGELRSAPATVFHSVEVHDAGG